MSPDRLSTTFAALADPTRRAILARLVSGETSVTELAEPFKMSLPAVSKHLKVLEDAGLIRRDIQGRTHYCSLQPQRLREAEEWIAYYRPYWEQRLDALERFLDRPREDR